MTSIAIQVFVLFWVLSTPVSAPEDPVVIWNQFAEAANDWAAARTARPTGNTINAREFTTYKRLRETWKRVDTVIGREYR